MEYVIWREGRVSVLYISTNMDKGNFSQTLKNSIDNYQKRTGIECSLVITQDADFKSLPQITFHHLFRIIMELLANIA